MYFLDHCEWCFNNYKSHLQSCRRSTVYLVGLTIPSQSPSIQDSKFCCRHECAQLQAVYHFWDHQSPRPRVHSLQKCLFSIFNSFVETYFFVLTPEKNSFFFSIFFPKEMVIDFLQSGVVSDKVTFVCIRKLIECAGQLKHKATVGLNSSSNQGTEYQRWNGKSKHSDSVDWNFKSWPIKVRYSLTSYLFIFVDVLFCCYGTIFDCSHLSKGASDLKQHGTQ